MSFILSELIAVGFILTQSWAVPAESVVQVDEVGNTYVVTADAVQLLPGGNMPPAVYSEASFGSIHSLDLRDPLKPMVYFRGSGKLVFLDNTLSVQGEVIDLFDSPVNQPELACSSVDHHVWVFDAVNQELLRLNAQLHIQARSGNLMQLIGHSIQATAIMERDNQIYLLDPLWGVLEFDLFASYLGTRRVKGIRYLDVRKERVYALTAKNEVYSWSKSKAIPEILELPPHGELYSVNILRDRFYLQSEELLECYKNN